MPSGMPFTNNINTCLNYPGTLGIEFPHRTMSLRFEQASLAHEVVIRAMKAMDPQM
jgi:hypothetical protein